MTGVKAVWNSNGLLLWDIYVKGKWIGSRRTYQQAIMEVYREGS